MSLYNRTKDLLEFFLKIIASYEQYLNTHDPFAHQPSTSSVVIDNSDQQSVIIAPCVPMVLGTKRERLPDETVVRRSKIRYLN